MVTRTVHSNGGHSMMNNVSLLTMLVSDNKNKDEDPILPPCFPVGLSPNIFETFTTDSFKCLKSQLLLFLKSCYQVGSQ